MRVDLTPPHQTTETTMCHMWSSVATLIQPQQAHHP